VAYQLTNYSLYRTVPSTARRWRAAALVAAAGLGAAAIYFIATTRKEAARKRPMGRFAAALGTRHAPRHA